MAGALVVARATVAQRDIEPIVGSEGERPAIVVGLRLRDAEHDAAAGRVDHGGRIAGWDTSHSVTTLTWSDVTPSGQGEIGRHGVGSDV